MASEASWKAIGLDVEAIISEEDVTDVRELPAISEVVNRVGDASIL